MFNFEKIYDISIPITNKTVNYPNNPEIEIENFADLKRGDSSNLTKIILGSHSGTHADAPMHTIKDGKSLDEISLKKFLGKAYVYDFTHIDFGDGIEISDFSSREPQEDEIILMKTKNSCRDYNDFYKDFIYLGGDTANYLKKKKIKLFAIDYLSVKKKGETDNRAHNELLENDIPIIEAVNLSKISSGEYYFIGLPLKFVGIDGSPLRAILLQ